MKSQASQLVEELRAKRPPKAFANLARIGIAAPKRLRLSMAHSQAIATKFGPAYIAGPALVTAAQSPATGQAQP